MIVPIERSYTVKRGDHWEGETFRLLAPTGNDATYWAGAAARSQIRVFEDGPLIKEFTISLTITEEAGRGVLTAVISATPAETKLIPPGRYIGDIEFSSNVQKKATFVVYSMEVRADVTY